MGMTPVHVNIASDKNDGASVHISLAPPGTWPSREVEIEQRWKPGAFKHKITATVFHRGLGIVLQQHDCGAGIMDQSPAFVEGNPYLPIIMMKSSRKVMFGASTVKAEGGAVGGATLPLMPMLTCGEPVPSPFHFPSTNTGNTVLVGFSLADIFHGWEDIYDAILIEAVCFVVSLIAGGGPFGMGDVIQGAIGYDPRKMAISAGVGLKRSVERSAASGWTEPISVKIDSGGGAGGGGAEVKWTPATGEVELQAEAGALTEKATVGAKRDPDGHWKPTGDLPPDLFD